MTDSPEGHSRKNRFATVVLFDRAICIRASLQRCRIRHETLAPSAAELVYRGRTVAKTACVVPWCSTSEDMP